MPPRDELLVRLANAYRRDLVALSDEAGTVAEGAFADTVDYRTSMPIFITAAAVARANRQAVTRSLRYLADALTIHTGRAASVAALDPRPFGDVEQIGRHLTTIVRTTTGGIDVEVRAAVKNRAVRLARAEPLGAAQRSARAAMSREKRVTGAVRQTSSRPCPVCSGRAGERLLVGVDVKLHPHCSCVPIPTTD